MRFADDLQPLTILMVSLTVSNLPFFSAAAGYTAETGLGADRLTEAGRERAHSL